MKTNKKQKKLASTVLRIALLVLAGLVIGLNVYSLNASRLAGDALPMPLGFGAAVVLSGSMEPELSVGDLLIVVPARDYVLGDVVVFQDGNSSVTHRIVAVSQGEVITRGDANNVEDPPIPIERIKGKVVMALPLVGYAVNAVKTPVGTLVVLGLAIVLMDRSFRKEKKKDDEELAALRAEIERLKQD